MNVMTITDPMSFSSKGAMVYQGTKEGMVYRVKALVNGRFAVAQKMNAGWSTFTTGRRWERLARAIVAANRSV